MRRLIRFVFLLFLIFSIAACSGQIVTSDNYTLGNGETLNGNLTMTSGNAVLESGSHVTGSVLITSGHLEVHGEVDGDIVMTSGDIELSSEAYMHGGFTASSGDFRADGARIDGQVVTDGSGMSVNVIINLIGQIFILPLVVIALIVFFVLKPGQRKQAVAKRTDEPENRLLKKRHLFEGVDSWITRMAV